MHSLDPSSISLFSNLPPSCLAVSLSSCFCSTNNLHIFFHYVLPIFCRGNKIKAVSNSAQWAHGLHFISLNLYNVTFKLKYTVYKQCKKSVQNFFLMKLMTMKLLLEELVSSVPAYINIFLLPFAFLKRSAFPVIVTLLMFELISLTCYLLPQTHSSWSIVQLRTSVYFWVFSVILL